MQKFLINRRVIHLGGYDPMTPEAFFARFNRELVRSASCWGLTAATRDFVVKADHATWVTELDGPDWKTITTFELLRWDDVIAAHRNASFFPRWIGGIAAFIDFSLHGALWRYLQTAWRYAAFFVYPFLALVLAFSLGMSAVYFAALSAGAGALVSMLAGFAGATAATFYTIQHTHIGHLLDDWIFAQKIVVQPDPAVSERLQTAAVRASAIPKDVDMLITGHSLGAVLAVEFIEKLLVITPASRHLSFLALGSSILKIALHSKATRLRQQAHIMMASHRVTWVEYQSLSDVMNFYKSSPAKLLNLEGQAPIVRQVRFSRMLNPSYYGRIKRNFFRLHCQFVSGNDLRAPYDYVIANCGPFEMRALAQSPDGAMRWLASDGALTADATPALLPSVQHEPDAKT